MILSTVANRQEARAAAQKAETGVLLLRSPAFGASSLGPAYFQALVSDARRMRPDLSIMGEIDCGDEPGLALASIRAGIDRVSVDLSPSVFEKLAWIAAESGVLLVSSKDRP